MLDFNAESRSDVSGTGRDIFNERPTQEERSKVVQKSRQTGSKAVLRTTLGDIHFQLFPDKYVEA